MLLIVFNKVKFHVRDGYNIIHEAHFYDYRNKSLASTAGISDAIIIFLYKAWAAKKIAIYCTIKYHHRCLRMTLYNLR